MKELLYHTMTQEIRVPHCLENNLTLEEYVASKLMLL